MRKFKKKQNVSAAVRAVWAQTRPKFESFDNINHELARTESLLPNQQKRRRGSGNEKEDNFVSIVIFGPIFLKSGALAKSQPLTSITCETLAYFSRIHILSIGCISKQTAFIYTQQILQKSALFRRKPTHPHRKPSSKPSSPPPFLDHTTSAHTSLTPLQFNVRSTTTTNEQLYPSGRAESTAWSPWCFFTTAQGCKRTTRTSMLI